MPREGGASHRGFLVKGPGVGLMAGERWASPGWGRGPQAGPSGSWDPWVHLDMSRRPRGQTVPKHSWKTDRSSQCAHRVMGHADGGQVPGAPSGSLCLLGSLEGQQTIHPGLLSNTPGASQVSVSPEWATQPFGTGWWPRCTQVGGHSQSAHPGPWAGTPQSWWAWPHLVPTPPSPASPGHPAADSSPPVFLSSFHDKNQNSCPYRLAWSPKALWLQLFI